MEQKRIDVINALADVRSFFEAREMDFMVVGSAALVMCGIDFDRKIHDIDIEVIVKSPEQEDVFKALCDAQGNNFYQSKEEYSEVTGSAKKPYIFTIGTHKMNVWVMNDNKFTSEDYMTYDGVKYNIVMPVLRKKAIYKRQKDYGDFSLLISKFSNLIGCPF